MICGRRRLLCEITAMGPMLGCRRSIINGRQRALNRSYKARTGGTSDAATDNGARGGRRIDGASAFVDLSCGMNNSHLPTSKIAYR